jgi:DNA (cytosine-5)-methyltransferase 1
MKYLSVCSGIEAATVAWHHLGWKPVGFAEIEKFPQQVLAHHYPDVPNFQDLTQHDKWPLERGAVDLLVGGTPCQSFSIAGKRGGMVDGRGQLTLEFVRLAEKLQPKWIVWENVPGVLSSGGGRDFGSFLGALAQLGYGFAYRVLDAQYFGVAQRRRRVFVVGYLGDWRCAAAVLFERESVRGDSSPRSKAQQEASFGARSGLASSGADATKCMNARRLAIDSYVEDDIASTVAARDFKSASDLHVTWPADVVPCMNAQFGDKYGQDNQHIDDGAGYFVGNVAQLSGMQVRRLTPVECERLQGFPDGYTDIRPRGKDTPDGPRYKALGNSMAVPVMRWIGERIAKVEKLKSGKP